MKRPIILGIVFLFAASFAGASTQVPGTLSGNVDWDSSQSPYIIQGKVEIPQGSVLHIGPGVHVVYQGVGELLVNGVLEVKGSASSPVVFDMTQTGLQSQFVLSGARADIANARFLGGIFLARDSQVDVQESEFTKGSGIYLQGKTQAVLRSNKVYGNATGAVLDGGAIKATFVFNTFVQNTYGLYLKNYLYLKFRDNSIHDNNTEVINATHGTAQLGDNYWGTMDDNALHLKTQGSVNYPPLQSLKDVLRLYIMTQLPEITVAQSERLAAKERRDEKAEALALKKFRKEQEREAKAAAQSAAAASKASASTSVPPPPEASSAASTPPPPASSTVPQEPAASAPAAVETPEETSAPVETAPPPSGVAEVKPLPPAPYTLTPVPNLPPEQDLNLEGAASNPTDQENESAPEATAPAAPAVEENSTLTAPAPPVVEQNSTQTAPPPPPTIPAAASTVPPLPPAVSDNSLVPPPPDVGTNAASTAGSSVPPPPPVPVASDDNSIPPPPPGMDTNATSIPSVPAPPSASSVPPPPVLPADNDSANGMSAVPPLPPAGDSGSASPAVPTPTAVPTGRVSTSGTSNDGLTAPSADLSQMALPPGSSPSTTGTQAPVTSVPDLALPPIEDLDVPPPKDLDLPPAGDLGNLDLDSKK
ncbi:MAG: right-handed parallel beta-helix repeat-containing protein [bacterium]